LKFQHGYHYAASSDLAQRTCNYRFRKQRG